MIETIGSIAITIWLLSWMALTYIAYRTGVTPLDAIVDIVKRTI